MDTRFTKFVPLLAALLLFSGFVIAEEHAVRDADSRNASGDTTTEKDAQPVKGDSGTSDRAGIRDKARTLKDAASNVRDAARDNGADAVAVRERAKSIREKAESVREEAMSVREKALAVRERFEERKAIILEKRQRYLEARSKAKEFRSEFDNARERLKKARAADKGKIRGEVRDNARKVLLHQVQARLNHLLAMREAGTAPENIDELVSFFENRRAQLEDENVSQEEVVGESKSVREFWKERRVGFQKGLLQSTNARFKALVERAERFSERLSGAVDRLKEAGRDTAKLEEGVANLRANVGRIRAAHEELSSKIGEAESHDDVKKLAIASNRVFKAMQKQLVADFVLVKRLFNAAKSVAAGGEADVVIPDASGSDLDEAVEGLGEAEEESVETEESVEENEDAINGKEVVDSEQAAAGGGEE